MASLFGTRGRSYSVNHDMRGRQDKGQGQGNVTAIAQAIAAQGGPTSGSVAPNGVPSQASLAPSVSPPRSRSASTNYSAARSKALFSVHVQGKERERSSPALSQAKESVRSGRPGTLLDGMLEEKPLKVFIFRTREEVLGNDVTALDKRGGFELLSIKEKKKN